MKYTVSLSIGENVNIVVNAKNEDEAFNKALDIAHQTYTILEGNNRIGLGYVFLNETIEGEEDYV